MTCPHDTWTIEPSTFRCTECGMAVDAPPIKKTIAAMRHVLATKRYRPPPPDIDETKPRPAPIPEIPR